MAAHQTLALVALREGRRSEAVDHMQRSGEVGALDRYADHGLAFRLAAYMLNSGERDRVADYFERYAQLAPWRKDMLLREAAPIREGRMPETYQRMFAAPNAGK